jgi:hypothetical protein
VDSDGTNEELLWQSPMVMMLRYPATPQRCVSSTDPDAGSSTKERGRSQVLSSDERVVATAKCQRPTASFKLTLRGWISYETVKIAKVPWTSLIQETLKGFFHNTYTCFPIQIERGRNLEVTFEVCAVSEVVEGEFPHDN